MCSEEKDLDMGYTTTITHRINTTDKIPVSYSFRRIPPIQIQMVKKHKQELLAHRQEFKPIRLPSGHCEKDGSIKLCINYRRLI